MSETHQVPIDTVNPDELPHDIPLNYDEVCRLVGNLYIQMSQQRRAMNDQFQAVSKQLQARLQHYAEENSRLKTELAQSYDRSTVSDEPTPDFDGQSEMRG